MAVSSRNSVNRVRIQWGNRLAAALTRSGSGLTLCAGVAVGGRARISSLKPASEMREKWMEGRRGYRKL